MTVIPQDTSSTSNQISEFQRPVTHKGTVTIPVEVRRVPGVEPRGKVTFRIIEGQRVELVPPTDVRGHLRSVQPKTQPLDFKALRDSAIEEKVRRSADESNPSGMHFVDTNIFIRHLTRDDPKKAEACLNLFQRAERREVIFATSEAIIAEVVYILSSSKQLFQLTRSEIRVRLYPLLSLGGLKLSHRRMYLRTLDLYAAYSIDFEDALLAAQMERQKVKNLYSYDRGFDHLPTITRREP